MTLHPIFDLVFHLTQLLTFQPKGKGKKFIDKKNSVTFHLVHRSQQDPLAADETAPQRVLVPAAETQAANNKPEKKGTEVVKIKEEEQKYGIFFDDDYNYLQHLRDANKLSVEWETVEDPQKSRRDKNKEQSGPKINLPSSVFASDVEEDVGLLNKAAPVSGLRLDVDPDIVAAMDEDFNYDDPDNQLEDNFLELANAEGSDNEFDELDEDGESFNGFIHSSTIFDILLDSQGTRPTIAATNIRTFLRAVIWNFQTRKETRLPA